MAIYHFSAQMISRGKGQSAVASASYRSGEKLTDERTGEIKFYQRDVQPESMILAPEHAPEWVQDRERLWNEVEKIEGNKNSQLAREINVALPVELSPAQQKELITNYAKEQFVDQGMVADIAIHRDDKNNPHAHIMLTIRPFDEKREWIKQKSKKEYILDQEGNFTYNNKGQKRTRKIDLVGWNKKELLQEWRKEWSNHANKMLEREGVNERIDHRSHKDRELETLPTQHLGHVASAMEKKGIETERGNYNREIEEYNQTVVSLQQYRETKRQLEHEKEMNSWLSGKEKAQIRSAARLVKGSPTISNLENRLKQIEGWKKALDRKNTHFKAIEDHYSKISFAKERVKVNQDQLDLLSGLKAMKQYISKDARRKKELASQEIQRHESIINEHQRKLTPYQEKYKFNTENHFKAISEEFNNSLPKQLEKLKNERETLLEAKSAIQNLAIKDLASKYPNQPEMAYMDYETAMRIKDLNQKHNKIHSVDEIKQLATEQKQAYKRATKQVSHVLSENERLDKVKEYLKGYQSTNKIVQYYENNPLYKGKILQGTLSHADKQNYESALEDRHRYRQLLMQHHVKDERDLQDQKTMVNQQLTEVPQLQEQATSLQESSGLFDAMVQGIEQAQYQMKQHQGKENKKSKSKTKRKTIEDQLELS